MLFSGRADDYQCEACASEYSDVMPTSILPILATVAFSTVFWSRALSALCPYRWLSIGFGLALSIGSLCGLIKLLDALTTRNLRRGICPRCGGKLARTGCGFYDTILPEPSELVVYLLTVALAFAVAVAAR
jgi:hypothetical protein